MGYLWRSAVVLSVVAAALWLAQQDLLDVPNVRSPTPLVASLTLVFVGFVLDAIAWRVLLRMEGIDIDLRLACASKGALVLAKYVPGKVLSIVGPASFVAERRGSSLLAASRAGLVGQVSSLALCGLLGAFALLASLDLPRWPVVLVLTLVLGSLFVGVAGGARVIRWCVMRLVAWRAGRSAAAASLYADGAAWRTLLCLQLATWGAWSTGFFLLLSAFGLGDVDPFLAFAFPLAACLGIVALVSPGGLGVREGALALLLVGGGMTGALAGGIALASRFWFLAGEIAFFGFGLAVTPRAGAATANARESEGS